MNLRSCARGAFCLLLAGALAGCLGTSVEAPLPKGDSYGSTTAHIIGSPTRLNASSCRKGIQQVTTFVPLWGVAVGILTFGIVVPMDTVFTCAK